MHKAKQIKTIKKKAYDGLNGAKRKRFCEAYWKALPQIYTNLHNGFSKTLREGENISCKKGCIYCCNQHISTDIGHGLLVVDYLYSHDMVLENFLSNYSKWRESVGDISNTIDTEYNLAARDRNPNAILEQVNSPTISKYFDIQAPCPFLHDSKCYIYDVRPLNCAAHFSKSPCDWCSNDSKEEPKISEIMPSYIDLTKLMMLPGVTPNLFLFRFTLPVMVFDVLVDGLPLFLNKSGIWGIFR